MNRSTSSTLSLLLLGALVLVAVVQVVQVDRVQADLAATRARLDTVAQQADEIHAHTVEEVRRCDTPQQLAADLADPANLLRPWREPEGWTKPRVAGGTLRRVLTVDLPSLHYNAGQNTSDINELYRYVGSKVGFQAIDDPGRFYPDLATKVTRADDGLSYEVALRPCVRWSPPAVNLDNARHAWLNDPHDVVADDFAFTLQVLQDPRINGRAAAMRPYVSGWSIEVVDATHFRLHVKRAEHSDLPMLLDFWPTPRWLYAHDEDGRPFDEAGFADGVNHHWYEQKAIGTGPYRFVEWQPGLRLVLEKNPAWHLGDLAPQAFDRVEMLVLKDPASWLRYLKVGQLDYTHLMPAQYLSEVKGREPWLGEPRLRYAEHADNTYFFVAYNERLPLFADRRVRTAMTLSLDRAGLLETAFAGLGELLSGPFDRTHPCYDHSIAPLPYDLARAAALLEEAGWTDRDGDGIREDAQGRAAAFSFLVPANSTEWDTVARTWKEALRGIGVRMDHLSMPWSDHVQRLLSRQFDAGVSSWVPMWEPDQRQIWHSREADVEDSSNFVSFRNPRADELADALAVEFDEGRRVELCHQFHALIAEEQPYSFFFQRRRAVLYWDHMTPPVFSKVNPQRDLRFFSFVPGP